MSKSTFEQLVALHSADVRKVAGELYGLKTQRIEERELFAIGLGALWEAYGRFDPAHGTKFWTFAFIRVRGAMLDAIRQVMPLPPSAYEAVATAREEVREAVPGSPAHEAALLRCAEAEAAAGLVAYDAMAPGRGEAMGVHEGADRPAVPDDDDEPRPYLDPIDDGASRVMRIDALDPESALVEQQRLASLRAAMAQLSIEERLILHGLYFDERGLVDRELGLSKSWASRLHTRALRRLRAMLAPEWCDAASAPKQAEPAAARRRGRPRSTPVRAEAPAVIRRAA